MTILALQDRRRTSADAGVDVSDQLNDAEVDQDVRELVARAQAGDVAAFGLLYERYVATIYKFVSYRTVGDQGLAEDLTADTFVRAMIAVRQFTWQGRDLGAWLVTIAKNLVADHYKSCRVRLTSVSETSGDELADVDWRTNPERVAAAGDTRARLLAAIGELTAEQRQCVMLRFYLDLSVAETAAAMGMNVGAVKALQYRATCALRRLLPASMAEAVAA